MNKFAISILTGTLVSKPSSLSPSLLPVATSNIGQETDCVSRTTGEPGLAVRRSGQRGLFCAIDSSLSV